MYLLYELPFVLKTALTFRTFRVADAYMPYVLQCPFVFNTVSYLLGFVSYRCMPFLYERWFSHLNSNPPPNSRWNVQDLRASLQILHYAPITNGVIGADKMRLLSTPDLSTTSPFNLKNARIPSFPARSIDTLLLHCIARTAFRTPLRPMQPLRLIAYTETLRRRSCVSALERRPGWT